MISLPNWFSQLMGRKPISTGQLGERLTARFLKKQGYRILKKNWQLKIGEIDLLAMTPDGCTLVIVEVKTSRRRDDQGTTPEMRVGYHKQKKLTQLACLVVRYKTFRDYPVRFDVVGVDVGMTSKPIIRHHQGAFEATMS